LVAVRQELGDLTGLLSHARWSKIGGRDAVTGFFDDVPVRALITGPGQVNCVQALTAAMEADRPAVLLQAGCAGGFAGAGLRVGDLAVATEEIDAHLGIEADPAGVSLAPLPFPVGRYGGKDLRGRYCMDAALSRRTREILKDEFSGEAVTVTGGPFLTVSTITATDDRAGRLYETHRACAESMEGAGAALVALHYGVAFAEVRSVSNLVGKRDLARWNLPLAFERCARAVAALLRGGIMSCGKH
jgi:futalosine hydrolase